MAAAAVKFYRLENAESDRFWEMSVEEKRSRIRCAYIYIIQSAVNVQGSD